MHTNKPRIHNKLKYYRKLHDYTLREIAFVLELKNTNRISRWEKGTVIPPTKYLFKLAKLYRTSSHLLLDDFYLLQATSIDLAEKKLREKREKFNDSS